MGYKTFSTLLLAGGLVVSATASAAGPSAAMLANTCAGCHGTNGSSVGPASPTIAGITEDYFIESMEAFQTGERGATIMDRIAKGYTADEIKAMAAYFSKQPFVRMAQQHDPEQAKLGRKLHKKYCEKCHEDGGRKADEGGILAGQWIPYLTIAMEDFRSGSREITKKMKKKVDEVTKDHGDASLDALIQYYGSQQ